MAPQIQKSATEVEAALRGQVGKEYLERMGILRENAESGGVEYQPAMTSDRKRRLSIELNNKFTSRPTQEDLMNLNILHSIAMANSIQAPASAVQQLLYNRQSEQQLREQGILPYSSQLDASLANDAAKLEKLLRAQQTGATGANYGGNTVVSSRLQGVARQLQQAQTRDALQSGLSRRGDYAEYVDSSVAPSLQATAKMLEQAKKRDTVSNTLAQRGTAQQSGVDTSIAASLQATAKMLETAQKRDAVSSGLQQRGTAEQSGVNTTMAASLQAAARRLETAQKKDAVSSSLSQRGTAEQSGVDTSLAPSLQAAAKALETAQKKDVVSSGLQRRGDASEYGVDSNVARSLQATAKALEAAKKKDAVSTSLAQRGTAEESGVDTSIAPKIQAAAKALESAKTKDAVSSGLQARSENAPDTGVNQNIARSLQPNAKALQYALTSDQINKELAFRHSTQHLMKQGKMYSDQMANALQPAAVDLEGKLHGRVGASDLQSTNILAASPNLDAKFATQAYSVNKGLANRSKPAHQRGHSVTLAPKLQSAAKEIAKHHRRMSLTKALDARPDSEELLAKGVLYAHQEKIAGAIQGSAIELENSLVDRPKEADLANRGIIENAQMDPSLRAAANALENKLEKNASSPKSDVVVAPKLQGAIKALEFQQKNLQLKRLLENQENTAKKQEKFGIDNKIAPSLQNAAKALELEQRKDKLNSMLAASTAAKEEYRANENEIYNLGLANSLRETAQQLAKQKRRDSLTRGLLARSTKQDLVESQILFDDAISPAIQSQAMQLAQQLDYLRKKGMISSLLDAKKQIREQYDMSSTQNKVTNSSESLRLSKALEQRPDSIELVKAGILHATPEVAHAIHDTINRLETQLGKRLTTEQLRDLGIMGSNPTMANSLQPTAAKLAGLLATQMKSEASKLARSLQPNAAALEKNLAKDKIKQQFNARPDRQAVIDSGVMPNAGVAKSIAGSAYDLEQNLHQRATSDYLEQQGILKDPKKHVKVGDHIKLNNGLTGKVKWIGISDVTNKELVGIALDYFNSMGNDGSIGNRRYFIVDEGFGIYAERKDISQYVTPPRPLVSQVEVDGLRRRQRAMEESELKARKKRVKEIRILLAQIGKIEEKAKEYGTFAGLSNEEKRLVGNKRQLENELNELTKRRLSLTLENAIIKRPTPEQMLERGVLKSFDISPALQSAAYLLEAKLRRRKSIDQIAMQRLFGNEGAFSSIEEMNIEFDKAIGFLENKLQRRPSVTTVKELKILKAAQTQIAPRLHGARDALEHKLKRRMSVTDMQNKGLLPSEYDMNKYYNENMKYMEDQNTLDKSHRRSLLNSSLKRRPTLDRLIAQNIIKSQTQQYSNDRRRRSIELELNERLQRRPSIVKLENQGILPYGNTALAASTQKLQRRRLSMTLKEKLQARVAREVLLEMGVLLPHQDINFSRNLGPAAASLSHKLKRRPSIENIKNIYRTPDEQERHTQGYALLRSQLNESMKSRPTMSHMIQKDMINHSSLDDYDITIRSRPAGIRFSEGTNFIGLYVDEVRPGSVPEALGVAKNDLLVAINAYNVERLHSNKVINLFRTIKLPMHVRFRRNGKLAHSQRIENEMATGQMVDNAEESDISPLGSPRESSANPGGIGINVDAISDAVVNKVMQTVMAQNNQQMNQLSRQMDTLIQSKQQSDKQLKKMSRTLDLMKTEINSLRIEKVRWKQESERLAKANSDLVDRILVLDHELEQMKAEMARVDGEYALQINKRPIGVTWSHANNRTQLKVANVEDSSLAELFNVESGDVLMSINNHNVENIDSDRVQTWFEKCPLPMNITFRRKEANLELERAKYALEKQRQEIWDRLNAKSDSDSSGESEYTDSEEDEDSDLSDNDEKEQSHNRNGSVKIHKKGNKSNVSISALQITKPTIAMKGNMSGHTTPVSPGRQAASLMTQKSLKKLPTTPRGLSTPHANGGLGRMNSLTQDITEMVIKQDTAENGQYQSAAIDALELEMKLELERLQKYNETGDDNVLVGGLTPNVSNQPHAHHHRLATLEQMWDKPKEDGSNPAAQFTPQQILQLQKLLDQQQSQDAAKILASVAASSNGAVATGDTSAAAVTPQPTKPKKKKKKLKKSKGIGAIASRFE